jgi:hypothetical protein
LVEMVVIRAIGLNIFNLDKTWIMGVLTGTKFS